MRLKRRSLRQAGLVLMSVLGAGCSYFKNSRNEAQENLVAYRSELASETAVGLNELGYYLSQAPAEMVDFAEWSLRFMKGKPEEIPGLEAEGRGKAGKRKEAFLKLMRSNPAAAVQFEIPYKVRKKLPQSVKDELEQNLTGTGRLEILAGVSEDGTPVPAQHVLKTGEREMSVHFSGEKPTRRNEAYLFSGVALEGEIALREKPYRLLTMEEVGDIETSGEKPVKRVCPTSKKQIETNDDALGGAAEVGESVYYLCAGGHITAYADSLTQSANTAAALAAAAPAIANGAKTLLYIRVNYPDNTTEPDTLATVQASMSVVDSYMRESSFGKVSIATTFTPTLMLPKTEVEYQAIWESQGYSAGSYALREDALSVARAAGFDVANFDLNAVHFSSMKIPYNYSGMARVGAAGMWLRTSSASVVQHELGHNFGAMHSNFWLTSDGTATGLGSNSEYGDSLDRLGSGSRYHHFNAYWKNLFGWIPDTEVKVVSVAAGMAYDETVRISAFDINSDSLLPRAFVVKSFVHDYWHQFRQTLGSGGSCAQDVYRNLLLNGLQLHWAPWAGSRGGTHLIDTTPLSAGGKCDSPIGLGVTFQEAVIGMEVTPLARDTSTTVPSLEFNVKITAPPPAVARLTVSGASGQMPAGGTLQFTAKAFDQYGSVMSTLPALVWSASCGSVSSEGIFTAPLVGGTTCIVSATSGAVVGQASILVYIPTVSRIKVTSPVPSPFKVGQSVQLQAAAWDQWGASYVLPVTFLWTGKCGTVSPTGLYTALKANRNCSVTAAAGTVSGIFSFSVIR